MVCPFAQAAEPALAVGFVATKSRHHHHVGKGLIVHNHPVMVPATFDGTARAWRSACCIPRSPECNSFAWERLRLLLGAASDGVCPCLPKWARPIWASPGQTKTRAIRVMMPGQTGRGRGDNHLSRPPLAVPPPRSPPWCWCLVPLRSLLQHCVALRPLWSALFALRCPPAVAHLSSQLWFQSPSALQCLLVVFSVGVDLGPNIIEQRGKPRRCRLPRDPPPN